MLSGERSGAAKRDCCCRVRGVDRHSVLLGLPAGFRERAEKQTMRGWLSRLRGQIGSAEESFTKIVLFWRWIWSRLRGHELVEETPPFRPDPEFLKELVMRRDRLVDELIVRRSQKGEFDMRWPPLKLERTTDELDRMLAEIDEQREAEEAAA